MKTKILQILHLAGSVGLPETALRMEIEMRYRVKVGDMDFAHALAELSRMGYATATEDELTGDTRWTINDDK